MSAEEACVINVQSGQDVCIPPHHINNQNVRKQGIIEKLKLLLGAVFGTEEADDEQALYRDSKTLLIISGVIMSANYSAVTSVPSNLENRDEGVRQGVLIPATLSLMTTLFVMAAQVAMPTFNFRKVKMLVALSIIFTAYSYINFVAMKLGHLSQEKAFFGEKEWHLFTPRDRKYPNGSRPNKVAGTRYWKVTGADKPITNKRRKQESGHHEGTCFLCWEGTQGSQDQLHRV